MTKETLFEQIDEIFSDWHGGNLHIGQEREELIKECPMCNEEKDCEGHNVCEDCGGRSF